MAIEQSLITGFLDKINVKYRVRDEEDIITTFSSDDGDKVMVVISLLENGEFLRMRTIKHLDDLIEQAPEEKRMALLEWMLKYNYNHKMGTWEYDPEDHDHRITTTMTIEDGSVKAPQFIRMLKVMMDSVDLIPEMKKVLGIEEADEDDVEKKRKELLAQLAALDDGI